MTHKRTKKPRATAEELAEQRRVVAELRAAGLTFAAIGEQLGMSNQRAHWLSIPIPTRMCRACGQPIPRWRQYHPECRPSNYRLVGRLRGQDGMIEELTGQAFGLWVAVRPLARGGQWICRCRCGTERAVVTCVLRKGLSRGCRWCVIQANRARARRDAATPESIRT